ncbi:MAG: Holliday junction resolvase RuvX [Planctomycetes bacterium]|nr:Holliday junction resolvase RuvX [Planctomycetota bacterium]
MASKSQPDQPLPTRGRLLGLDYGTKRVGLALSNLDQTIATPHETYHRRDLVQDARYLARVVQEYTVVGLVVGLPVHMSGDEGEKAREARAFGNWAAQATGKPVVFTDERYTTAQANEHLAAAQVSPKKRQALRDMLAAQILLQSYLDSTRRNSEPGALA